MAPHNKNPATGSKRAAESHPEEPKNAKKAGQTDKQAEKRRTNSTEALTAAILDPTATASGSVTSKNKIWSISYGLVPKSANDFWEQPAAVLTPYAMTQWLVSQAEHCSMPQVTKFLVEYKNTPPKRPVEPRLVTKNNTAKPKAIEVTHQQAVISALVQIWGDEHKGNEACGYCVRGKGHYQQCVSIKDYAKGSCGSCDYGKQGTRCGWHENQQLAGSSPAAPVTKNKGKGKAVAVPVRTASYEGSEAEESENDEGSNAEEGEWAGLGDLVVPDDEDEEDWRALQSITERQWFALHRLSWKMMSPDFIDQQRAKAQEKKKKAAEAEDNGNDSISTS